MNHRHSAVEELRQWAAHLTAHHLAARQQARPGEVYQSSTISALLDGVYDGDATVADILRHGDFGLGTFNRLDGEMVVLDGTCYRLRSDGSATRASPTDRTPFAAITHFHADFNLLIDTPIGRGDVQRAIDARLDSPNLIYAVSITGTFTDLHTRTVAAQTPPYPPLTTATEGQAENFNAHATGTMVGFRTPDFEQGIAVAGYHLHFLDEQRTGGGHVLDFTAEHAKISVSEAAELHLSLPTSGAFLEATLAGPNLDDQIRKSEGGGEDAAGDNS